MANNFFSSIGSKNLKKDKTLPNMVTYGESSGYLRRKHDSSTKKNI